jgi:hypothetical protein
MREPTDENIKARIAAMTWEERQALIANFRRAGWDAIADHLQSLLDASKRELN